jgi:ligand-binding SRPBCC domain-containing protein
MGAEELALTRRERSDFLLRASHRLPLKLGEVFTFFEDPRNLSAMTPPWLAFRMKGECGKKDVCLGAEFDYTIRWLGLTIPWRSRITEYRRGKSFTDEQVRGPYRSWVHRHLFLPSGEGTLMVDEVDYSLYLAALPVRRLIEGQLRRIFLFRQAFISEWAAEVWAGRREGPRRERE